MTVFDGQFPAMKSLSAIFVAASVAAAQTISGAFDCLPAGDFTLCQNLWGASKRLASLFVSNQTKLL